MNAEVTSIKVEHGRATGVVLANGEEIAAQTILSAADPKRTFLSLVGPMELPPTFVWNVQSIKMRGSVAKVHLGVESLPDGMTPFTTYAVAPSLRYLEKAYDAAKYGEISEKPYLEVTTTENVISIHFQFAPYQLKNGKWEDEREKIETLAVDALAEHFPDLKSKVQSLNLSRPLISKPPTPSPKATSTTDRSCSTSSCSCVPSPVGRTTKRRLMDCICAAAVSMREAESAAQVGAMRRRWC